MNMLFLYRLFRFAWFVTISGLVSCSVPVRPFQTYEGPRQPTKEISTLLIGYVEKPYRWHTPAWHPIDLVIDGKTIPAQDFESDEGLNAVTLLPGQHEIKAAYFDHWKNQKLTMKLVRHASNGPGGTRPIMDCLGLGSNFSIEHVKLDRATKLKHADSGTFRYNFVAGGVYELKYSAPAGRKIYIEPVP